MNLRLERIYKNQDYTIGKLYIDNIYFCDTIEDAIREEKVYGKTAIDSGKYEIIINFSNRFKRLLPLLLNVPKFEGIRIHRGNSEKDSSGCIIIGENKVKGKVINSTKYEMLLVEKLKKSNSNHIIDIVDKF